MRPWESARVAEAQRETEPRVESLLAESEQERKAVLPVERPEERLPARSAWERAEREESRTAENPTRSGPQESLADAEVERSREPARTERSRTEWSWPLARGWR